MHCTESESEQRNAEKSIGLLDFSSEPVCTARRTKRTYLKFSVKFAISPSYFTEKLNAPRGPPFFTYTMALSTAHMHKDLNTPTATLAEHALLSQRLTCAYKTTLAPQISRLLPGSESIFTAPGMCPTSYNNTSSSDAPRRTVGSFAWAATHAVSTHTSGCAYSVIDLSARWGEPVRHAHLSTTLTSNTHTRITRCGIHQGWQATRWRALYLSSK